MFIYIIPLSRVIYKKMGHVNEIRTRTFNSFVFFSILKSNLDRLAHCLNFLLSLGQNQAVKKKKQVVFEYNLLIIVYCAFERKIKFIKSLFFFKFWKFSNLRRSLKNIKTLKTKLPIYPLPRFTSY